MQDRAELRAGRDVGEAEGVEIDRRRTRLPMDPDDEDALPVLGNERLGVDDAVADVLAQFVQDRGDDREGAPPVVAEQVLDVLEKDDGGRRRRRIRATWWNIVPCVSHSKP